MNLELTAQQGQAIEQKGSEPVEFVDRASSRVYVLLAREQDALVKALLPQASANEEGRDSSPPCSQREAKPLRQRVKDLPTPQVLATFAQKWCSHLGLIGRKARQDLAEQLKLQHYYGGGWIAYLRSEEGPVVVAVADSLHDPSFDQQLSYLTEEERRGAIISSPPVLFDE